jgi:hypothetical protein
VARAPWGEPIRRQEEAFTSSDDASPVFHLLSFLPKDYFQTSDAGDKSPIFAPLKSARRAKLKSQTAPTFPFRGKVEHTGIRKLVNGFWNYFAEFFQNIDFSEENR